MAASDKVLVAGGFVAQAPAELYDPGSRSWSATESMAAPRRNHSASLLPVDGFASADLYDPTSGQWAATASLIEGRQGHTATLLPNGVVLVVGGRNSSFEVLASAELYDPGTGS